MTSGTGSRVGWSEMFDYIIIGGGSSGCVLAERLSAEPMNRVLLIEAGGPDRHPLIPMPMGIGKTLMDPKLCWYYPIEAEPGNGGEPRVFMRGRVLGGSSSVNGMVYCRGQPEDYDGWVAQGCTGWGWDEMRAAFRAIEDHELGDDGERGVGGPLHVSIRKDRTPLTEALLDAADALGTPRRQDVNRPDQEGIGYCPVTIKRGRRVSAADAFLKPAISRSNLKVVTGTQIDRLLIEGRRVVGVSGKNSAGAVEYRTSGEVILSCGTIQSPKLLMLSGIGPAEHLQQMKIPVIADLPGVGSNLLEHKTLTSQFRLSGNFSLNREVGGWRAAKNMLRYIAFKSGPMASTYDLNAFIKTHPGLAQPDAQILFWGLTVDKTIHDRVQVEQHPGILAMGYPLRTNSKGRLRLRSGDPDEGPMISTNFLATDHDRNVMVGIARYVRRLFAHPLVEPFVAAETYPGIGAQRDEDILEAARRDQTCQHAVGTCRMGSLTDRLAVLDPSLRVKGVEGLRVVDLSAMPTQVSGNPNGPAMAFAWRAAQIILAAANARQEAA